MKKIYLPSLKDLEEARVFLGKNGSDYIYKYLVAKQIEKIALEGTIYSHKGMLKNEFKYIQEDPYISVGIAKSFPEEIKYSNYAVNDIDLCEYQMRKRNPSIYRLDNLSFFEEGAGVLTNTFITSKTIRTLKEELPSNPEYRFTYKDNSLLDNIFNCEITDDRYRDTLACIDPFYALLLDGSFKKPLFIEGLKEYSRRYFLGDSITQTISNYKDQDIIKNPDQNVKRLIKNVYKR